MKFPLYFAFIWAIILPKEHTFPDPTHIGCSHHYMLQLFSTISVYLLVKVSHMFYDTAFVSVSFAESFCLAGLEENSIETR